MQLVIECGRSLSLVVLYAESLDGVLVGRRGVLTLAKYGL